MTTLYRTVVPRVDEERELAASGSSGVKIWRLTPQQMENYEYGMDLGKPHEIQEYQRYDRTEEEKEDVLDRIKRGIATRDYGHTKLNHELYQQDKAAGMSDKEIAFKYKINKGTLTSYKSLWRKGEKA